MSGDTEAPRPDGDLRRADDLASDDTLGPGEQAEPLRSPFSHPPWTVGLVLVAGAITLLFAILVNPIWLVVGSPFVIALLLWVYIKLFVRVDGREGK